MGIQIAKALALCALLVGCVGTTAPAPLFECVVPAAPAAAPLAPVTLPTPEEAAGLSESAPVFHSTPVLATPELPPGIAELIAASQREKEARQAKRDRAHAAEQAAELADREDAAASSDKASHVAWVHDHCSARQPPPVVTCNPVCLARRACFVWTCEEHPDWAEEVSIYDCDPHRNARAIRVNPGIAR